MDSRVRQLYKELLHIGRDYPMEYGKFKLKLKSAFQRQDRERGIVLGKYVYKEIEALIFLKRYRTLRRIY